MGGVYYQSVPLAYADAPENAVIMLMKGTLTMVFTADRNITVNIRGGYDSSYSTSQGVTLFPGAFTVKLGRVIVERVTIK